MLCRVIGHNWELHKDSFVLWYQCARCEKVGWKGPRLEVKGGRFIEREQDSVIPKRLAWYDRGWAGAARRPLRLGVEEVRGILRRAN